MAGRYVPPHLRNKSQTEPSAEDAPLPPRAVKENLTLDEIDNHFWPAREDGEDDNGHAQSRDAHGKTLHDSAQTPGKLAYVILYSGANPRWEGEGIIYTKSSLDLLPRTPDDKNENSNPNTANGESPTLSNGDEKEPSNPIAIFKQTSKAKRTTGFQFEGWFQIERIAFLEPHTDELVRMLEQKWTRTDRQGKASTTVRTGESWERSLGFRWAVVKLSKADGDFEPPKIERLPDRVRIDEGPKKSVNEMLAEMRVKDSNDGAGGKAAVAD